MASCGSTESCSAEPPVRATSVPLFRTSRERWGESQDTGSGCGGSDNVWLLQHQYFSSRAAITASILLNSVAEADSRWFEEFGRLAWRELGGRGRETDLQDTEQFYSSTPGTTPGLTWDNIPYTQIFLSNQPLKKREV